MNNSINPKTKQKKTIQQIQFNEAELITSMQQAVEHAMRMRNLRTTKPAKTAKASKRTVEAKSDIARGGPAGPVREVRGAANEDSAFQRVKIRSRRADAKLLAEEGGPLTDAEFAEKLGVASRSTVKNYREQNKIFAVPRGARNLCYPGWQIHKKRLLPGLEETLHLLTKRGLHPFSYVLFFLTPTEALKDERPLDLLRRNEVEPVIEQARYYGSS